MSLSDAVQDIDRDGDVLMEDSTSHNKSENNNLNNIRQSGIFDNYFERLVPVSFKAEEISDDSTNTTNVTNRVKPLSLESTLKD